MRSRTDIGRIAVATTLAICLSIAAASAQEHANSGVPERPAVTEIDQALARVKADPNLAAEHTIKTLKWRTSNTPPPSGMPAWLMWIVNLFRWMEQSARALVWVAAAVLAGLLGVYVSRFIRARNSAEHADGFVAPTHVRDLDIRPETLPADIGGAARALWDRGEHRAALALLYRGMLSRLAHVHRVPIRDSSTEGDCLALAVNHLPEEKHAYTSQLVRVWQRAVYGHESVIAATVYELCDGFAPALDAIVPAGSPSEVVA